MVEPGDRLASLVLERQGRHREQGIVGEQRDHPVDVTALDRVGDRWSLLIVDALLEGPRRFGERFAYVELAPGFDHALHYC